MTEIRLMLTSEQNTSYYLKVTRKTIFLRARAAGKDLIYREAPRCSERKSVISA